MKNYQALFLLIICSLIAVVASAQPTNPNYISAYNNTRFTKKSPTRNDMPYDSVQVRVQAGEQLFVQFQMRKVELWVEVQRPSGALDTLRNITNGAFGYRTLNRLYTAKETGMHTVRLCFKDEDIKRMYNYQVGVVPSLGNTNNSAYPLVAQRMVELTRQGAVMFSGIRSAAKVEADLTKITPATKLMSFSKDKIENDYEAILLENQSLSTAMGLYQSLRAELVNYLGSLREKEPAKIQDNIKLGPLEKQACVIALPQRWNRDYDKTAICCPDYVGFRGATLTLAIEEIPGRNFMLSFRITPGEVLRQTETSMTTSGFGFIANNTNNWLSMPADAEERIKKITKAVQTGLGELPSSAEIKLIEGEQTTIDKSVSVYTIKLPEQTYIATGRNKNLTYIQFTHLLMAALYVPGASSISFDGDVVPGQDIIKSFRIQSPQGIARLAVKVSAVSKIESIEIEFRK